MIGSATLVTPAVGVHPLIAAALLLGGAIVAADEVFGTSEDIVVELVGDEDAPVQYWRINDEVWPFALATKT